MSLKLNAQKREILGKKVKNLRKEGIIPAELFGPNHKNIHLSIPKKEFNKIYKEAGKNTVIEVNIEGENEAIPTMITDVQIHPINREPISADFYVVSRDTKIETEVPLEFTGEAPAEKEGLIVVKVLSEVEVKALPQNVPNEIKADISNLETTKDHVLVKDLSFPSNVEAITPEDTTVVTVSEKEPEVAEEESTPAAEELAEEESKEESSGSGGEESKEK